MQRFLIFLGNTNIIFIALLKIVINIPGNSCHLVIYDRSWVRTETHQNFAVHLFADMNEHPGIDYSVVFCPARGENF